MKRFFLLIVCLTLLCTCACAPATTEETTIASTGATVSTTENLTAQGIKNIILIIGDGMGNAQIEAGQLAAGKEYIFQSWHKTLVNTNSLDGNGAPLKITDSAAAGTAMATGTLTTNGHIAQDPEGIALKTILDHASEEYGKATGVVTTDLITGATPATFSGHAADRYNTEDILMSQAYSNVNLLCGRYSASTLTNKDLFVTNGYTICDSIYAAKNSMDAEKVYWQLNVGDYDVSFDALENVTVCALDYLSQDPDGFVLMVEQAQVDKHGHSNTFEGVPKCVNILNNTVEAVLKWIDDRTDTAIIVTADHETGGLLISTEPEYPNKYTFENGKTVYYQWSTTEHTQTEVSAFMYGFDPDFSRFYTEESPGAIKNSNIFDMMLELLKNPMQHGE